MYHQFQVVGAIVPTKHITLSSTTENVTIVYSLYKNSYSATDGTLVGAADQTYTAPIILDSAYFPLRIASKSNTCKLLR